MRAAVLARGSYMLVLSILSWLVAVYSLRVAVFGEPVHNLLWRIDTATLRNLDVLVQSQVKHEDMLPHDAESLRILRRFSRLTVLGLAGFGLEMGLLVYLVIVDQLVWLSLALLFKNVLGMSVSLYYARAKTSSESVFLSIRNMPAALVWLDRLSAGLSAAAFMWIFLLFSGLLPIVQ
jgi:hypothetical protein